MGRFRMALLGSALQPSQRLGRIPRHTTAERMGEAEMVLRAGMTALRGAAEPAGCLGLILRHTSPSEVRQAKEKLGLEMALPRRPPQPTGRVDLVLRNATTRLIGQAQQELGISMPVLRRPAEQLSGPGLVPGHAVAFRMLQALPVRTLDIGGRCRTRRWFGRGHTVGDSAATDDKRRCKKQECGQPQGPATLDVPRQQLHGQPLFGHVRHVSPSNSAYQPSLPQLRHRLNAGRCRRHGACSSPVPSRRDGS